MTLTPTQTFTPTITPVPTITPTPTVTPTPTNTLTPTPTYTPTATWTPTVTFNPNADAHTDTAIRIRERRSAGTRVDFVLTEPRYARGDTQEPRHSE